MERTILPRGPITIKIFKHPLGIYISLTGRVRKSIVLGLLPLLAPRLLCPLLLAQEPESLFPVFPPLHDFLSFALKNLVNEPLRLILEIIAGNMKRGLVFSRLVTSQPGEGRTNEGE